MGLERAAWYGSRSVWVLYLWTPIDEGGLGLDQAEAMAVLERGVWLGLPFTLLAGLVAIAVGPHAIVVVGALLAAAGQAMLFAGAGSAPVAMSLVIVGAAVLKPGVWAALGNALATTPPHLRAAAFVLPWMAIQIAALAASVLGPAVSFPGAFGVAAGTTAAVALGASLLGGLSLAHPEPTPANPAAAAAIGVVLAVLVTPYVLASSVSGTLRMDALVQLGLGPAAYSGALAVDPVASFVVGAVAAAILAGAHALEVRWPALIVSGLAMVAAALGGLALHPALLGAAGFAALGVGTFAFAATEVVVMAVATSWIAGGQHPRLSTLLVAGFLASTQIAAVAPALFAGVDPAFQLLLLAPCGLAGLVLAGGAVLARDTFTGARETAPPAPEVVV